MERAVQVYAIVNFTIIGVSHLLRPRAWVDFFMVLRSAVSRASSQGHPE